MTKAKDGTYISQRQRKELALQAAHGTAHLLTVGVGANLRTSGFRSLKKCDADAAAIWKAFRETKQLNADPSKIYELTSSTADKPSRGTILAKLRELVQGAEAGDRIIFFFSGHGHRLNDKFYLVPSDAYDSEDPDSLLLFDRVTEILNSSAAKQKIVILDACFSGPDTAHLKFGSQPMSMKFLTDYLSKTKGVVVLSSSGSDQASTTKSPNPQLSLFTHFVVKGLRGESAALTGRYLTIPSLFSYVSQQVIRVSKSHGSVQQPGITMDADGIIMLADFTPRLVTVDEVDLGESPVAKLAFKEKEYQDVRDILTFIRNWHYSVEWIQDKANSALREYVEEDLGEKKAALRRAMGWNTGDVVIDETGLSFPAGDYTVTYKARDKKKGELIHTVTFEPDWFNRPDDIPKIIEALGITPTTMRFLLSKPCEPVSMIPGLEAAGWALTSELDDKIIAARDGYSLIVSPRGLTLGGLAPSDIFGAASDKDKARITMAVLSLLHS